MPFVLDASVTACWMLPDEGSLVADAARLRIEAEDAAVVPAIWWFEIRNTALLAERCGRMRPDAVEAFLDKLRGMAVRVEHLPDDHALFSAARGGGLTVYDAAYLELAQRLTLPLATLDRHLAAAARAAGVALL